MNDVLRRLDRILCNSSFNDVFADVTVKHLPRVLFDHSPLCLRCKLTMDTSPTLFRFLNTWTLHDNFSTFFAAAWNKIPVFGGMCGLYAKLQSLKSELRHWNKEIYGNIFGRVAVVEDEFTRMESAYDQNPSP